MTRKSIRKRTAVAVFLAALVASCLRGALPPVDFRAVCLVRAIVKVEGVLSTEVQWVDSVGWGEKSEGWIGKVDPYI